MIGPDGAAGDDVWWRLPDSEIQAVKAHPRFAEMIRASTTAGLDIYDADPVTTGSLRDMALFITAMMALYLHFTGGLTLTRLREVCLQMGVTGRGRALAILTRLRMIGYVRPGDETGDARVRLYVPTPAMTAAIRRRIRVELEAYAMIDPGIAPALAAYDLPEGLGVLMRYGGEGLMKSLIENPGFEPALGVFTERTAGIMILYQLMADGDTGAGFPPTGPIRASVNGLAKRFKVSRTHVMRLLRDAEIQGLLRRAPDAGEGYVVLVRPDRIEQHFAAHLLALGVVARRAALDLDAA